MKKIILLFISTFILGSCNVMEMTGIAETDLGNNFGRDLKPGLMHFWKFAESAGADKMDSVGGLTLDDTSTSGFSIVSSPAGAGVDCASNGSGSAFFNHITANQFILDTANFNYNFSFWVKPNLGTPGDVNTIMQAGSGPSTRIEFTFAAGPIWDMTFEVGTGGAVTITSLLNGSDFSNWNHISINLDTNQSQIDVYKNGNYFGTYGVGYGGEASIIFRLCSDNAGTVPLNGSLDSFGVWNRLLSEEDIRALYNGNNNVD
jgi:hypothetical protein